MRTSCSIRETFAVFEDPRNLGRITPSWMNFKVVTPEPLDMRQGAKLEYTIRWLGVPLRWTTNIDEYRPPHAFVDRQARGPFEYWRHRHEFSEVDGGTLIRDEVEYELPFGMLGRLTHWLMIAAQLRAIFEFRFHALRRMFGLNAVQTVAPRIRPIETGAAGSAPRSRSKYVASK